MLIYLPFKVNYKSVTKNATLFAKILHQNKSPEGLK